MVHEVSNQRELQAAAAQVGPSGTASSVERKVAEPAPAAPAADQAVDEKDLHAALSRVREVFQNADSRLEFSVDPDLDRVVVKVMDGESGTVIRQIPQQEVIDLAKRLETPTGLLLHHKA